MRVVMRDSPRLGNFELSLSRPGSPKLTVGIQRSPGLAEKSSLDQPAFSGEEVAKTVALVALQLDEIHAGLSAGAAGFLQFLCEGLQERCVLRKAVDHGHLLARACVLEIQRGRDSRRNGFLRSRQRRCTMAVRGRPSALCADAPLPARIDNTVSHGSTLDFGPWALDPLSGG